MMTVLHAIQWPLACLCGWAASALARRRRMSWIEAYAMALVPGALIAIALALFGPAGQSEQPWQGLIVWAAWSAFGVCVGVRVAPRRRITTLDLSAKPGTVHSFTGFRKGG
jgi:hypothetical protein